MVLICFVDKNYVSAQDFVSGREVEVPFQQTPSDIEILKIHRTTVF
jgi:hypothetical protein